MMKLLILLYIGLFSLLTILTAQASLEEMPDENPCSLFPKSNSISEEGEDWNLSTPSSFITFSHYKPPLVFPFIRPTTNIGPLLREITPTSFRFLFQGDMPAQSGTNKLFDRSRRYNKVVLRVEDKTRQEVVYESCSPLDPQSYHLTEIECSALTPSSDYQVYVGYVRTRKELESPCDFREANSFEIRTLPEEPSETSSFILFSCWRYNKRGPFTFGKKKSRQAWQAIRQNIEDYKNKNILTDAILGMGDTVYQDPWGRIGASCSSASFITTYMHAYRLPEFKAVTSQIPLLSIADDHAVRNDSGSREEFVRKGARLFKKRREKLYDKGIAAARLCELPHNQPPEHLWRTELIGNQPIFFTDLRRERSDTHGRLISETQFSALKEFLLSYRETIPLLVFSVPFSTQDGNGSCTDYPLWQKELMEFASQERLQFIILSGDTHVGYTHIFQAYDSENNTVGPPIFEATVSGLNAVTRGKALTTKSIIDRSYRGGLLFSSMAPPLGPTSEALKHPVLTENLFARLTISHVLKHYHIEYFSATDGHKLLGLRVIYQQEDGFIPPTMEWD